MGRPGLLGMVGRHCVTVQPGCTNLGLGTLLHSRTNADDDGPHGLQPGSGTGRMQIEHGERLRAHYIRRTYGEKQ